MDQASKVQLEQLIGHGAFSKVWLALIDGERVAIKLYNSQGTGTVERELDALS